jgi:transposase
MTGHVMVGCDPHKLSVTLAAIDPVGVDVGAATFANDAAGLAEAASWVEAVGVVERVGIEGSAGHGRHLADLLVAAGHDVREVPARRTAQRRRDRRRPKTDRDDALAIAREVAADPSLGPCRAARGSSPTLEELAVVEAWRADLVERRKRVLNVAESLLGALPLSLLDEVGRTGKTLARLRRASRCVAGIHGPTRARLDQLNDLLAAHDDLSDQIRRADQRLGPLVDATNTTLREETGISTASAARLLVEIGDPSRFRTEAGFARWCGTAAVAASSGEGDRAPTRHRLDLGGNRRVNAVIHLMSVVQGRCSPDARAYLDRKRSEGKTSKEARRAHKRHLANRIIRRMWHDATRQQPAPA